MGKGHLFPPMAGLVYTESSSQENLDMKPSPATPNPVTVSVSKKPYVSPRMTVYGAVRVMTAAGTRNGKEDTNNNTDKRL